VSAMVGEGLGRGRLVYLSCSYASFGFLYIAFLDSPGTVYLWHAGIMGAWVWWYANALLSIFSVDERNW